MVTVLLSLVGSDRAERGSDALLAREASRIRSMPSGEIGRVEYGVIIPE
jgi:hypothetical protein